MSGDIEARIEELLSGEEFQDLNELVKMGSSAVPKLTELLSKSTDPLIRKRSAIALGRIQDKSAQRSLVEATEDSDPTVVLSAVDALVKFGDVETSRNLIPLLKSADSSVRASAAKALGDIKARDALTDLEKMAEEDETEFVRSAASKAVHKLSI